MTPITEQEPMAKATISTPGDRDVRIERIFNARRINCSRSIVLGSTVAFLGGGVGCCATARLAEMSTPAIRATLAERHCQYGIVI